MQSQQAPWVDLPTLRSDPPRRALIDHILTRARRRSVTRSQRFVRRSMLRLAYVWLSLAVVLMMAKLGWDATLKMMRR
jgi:hypothetical protein